MKMNLDKKKDILKDGKVNLIHHYYLKITEFTFLF